MISPKFLLIFMLLPLIAFSGCTVRAALQSPDTASFISKPERLERSSDVPFDLFWSAPEISSWLFDTVVIDQVSIDHIKSSDWFYSASAFIRSEESYIERVFDLSVYLESALAENFKSKAKAQQRQSIQVKEQVPQVYYNMSVELFPETPSPLPLFDPIAEGERTLLVKVSLSEVIFGDPLLYAGLFAVPVPGIANISTGFRASSLVFQAKFIDQESGTVIAELVDRRFPQLKLVDLNRLFVGFDLKELADSFAEDLAALFFRSRGEALRRRSPVSLLPW